MSAKLASLAIIGAASLVGWNAPASAQVTTLDFSGNVCGPAGNTSCGNNSGIGSTYGSIAGRLNVSWRSVNVADNSTFVNFANYWSTGYGDLTGVAWVGVNPTSQYGQITFAPLTGYQISLISFRAGCFRNAASCQTVNYNVLNGANFIASGSQSTGFPGSALVNLNTGYFNSPLVLNWGPDAYNVGVDDITFDIRPIAAGVPEPMTWAMMILGFGVIGGAMRSRRWVAESNRALA